MKENSFKASLTVLVSVDQGRFLLHPGTRPWLSFLVV